MKHINPFQSIRSAIVLVALGASGCATLVNDSSVDSPAFAQKQRTGSASSLVEYLYPRGEFPPGRGEHSPLITVPVRVGVAFVPATRQSDFSLTSVHKQALLQRMKQSFRDIPVIQDIRIIPEQALTPRGGIQDLRRVANQHGVDLMALVSYDQIGSVHDNPLSLTYWTIVGAFILPGNTHEVQTVVDTGVFDVRTSKLIIKAAGQDKLQELSPGVVVRAHFRQASERSFESATDKMINNLRQELSLLQQRLRQNSHEVDLDYAPGYQGPRVRGGYY